MKLFLSFTLSVSKCGGNCSTINDLYAPLCVPNKVKNLNVKVFNLMLGVNETSIQFKMNCVSVNVD